MYLPGHIAGVYLASRRLRLDARIAVAASLLPDVVDKVGYYVLRATPDGRVPSHTLLGLAITLLAAALVGLLHRHPRRVAYAWSLGYGLHLVLDLLNGPAPLLWPIAAYDFSGYRSLMDHWREANPWRLGLTVAAELCLTLWAVLVWRREHPRSPGQRTRPLEAQSR